MCDERRTGGVDSRTVLIEVVAWEVRIRGRAPERRLDRVSIQDSTTFIRVEGPIYVCISGGDMVQGGYKVTQFCGKGGLVRSCHMVTNGGQTRNEILVRSSRWNRVSWRVEMVKEESRGVDGGVGNMARQTKADSDVDAFNAFMQEGGGGMLERGGIMKAMSELNYAREGEY